MPVKIDHSRDDGMNLKNQIIGDVNAVSCEGCRINAGKIHVAALGLENVEIRVEGGVVIVRKIEVKEVEGG